MLTRRSYAIGMAVSGIMFWVVGCGSGPQAQTTLPVSNPAIQPAPIPSVEPVAASEDPTAATDAAETDAVSQAPKPASPERLAKQAEEHARAIEALLAAREQEQDQMTGVRVIRNSQESPAAPSAARPPGESTQKRPPVEVKFEEPQSPIRVTGDPEARPVPTPAAEPTAVVVGETEPVAGSMSRANTPMRVTSEQPSEVVTPSNPRSGLPNRATGVDAIEQQLARRAREYPRDLPSQLDYQLLLFTKDEQVPRNADLAGLASEDRELLTALVDGLTNFRNAIRADNNMLMNRKIRPIVEMSDRLRSRADLSIPNAMLCREVKGFGMYTPIETTRFEAGKAHKVIVYSEVENFASVLNDKSVWETRLEQELVLYTESGLPVWEEKTPTTDFCRNRRRDFFVARIVTIPANLTMGRYVLKVSVTDQQASRIAETSIPIAVVAK